MSDDETGHNITEESYHRRLADVQAAAEFAMLKHQFTELSSQQAVSELRIKHLESEADILSRKISIGKGILYGFFAATGGLGLILADKMKHILDLLR